MSSKTVFTNVFHHVHDVVVFGAGYAGFAAALLLAESGRKTLLVDRGGDVVWESGRAMMMHAGSSAEPRWNKWQELLARHHASVSGRIAPAAAEVLASQALVRTKNLNVLYYASPAAVQWEGSDLASVILATKAGLKRIVAKQFLDATETGELINLLPGEHSPRRPLQQQLSVYFQSHAWQDDLTHTLALPHVNDASMALQPSCWPHERCLSIRLAGSQSRFRSVMLQGLEAAHQQLGDVLHEAVLTHASVMPLPVYEAGGEASLSQLPRNVAVASPAYHTGVCDTLASRYELGIQAAGQLQGQHQASVSENIFDEALPVIQPASHIQANVAIAGLGTGGLMAAVAAGRNIDKVVAFDSLPFAGGIGSGGGIHAYYHGVKGGLQQELDERIHKIMPLFGGIAKVQGFHPHAKKIVADAMLQEAGVVPMQGMLAQVQLHDGVIQSVMIATPRGVKQITAPAWIDASGDGDLAAMAGASFELGRHTDGQLHAFTQSSGRASMKKGRMSMFCINYDAGHVDPTDPQDLTRARLLGIGHYEQDQYRHDDHPTYIAPVIGIRQGRQVQTDYTLTLSDLICKRQFDDCIGYTSGHYDNHAVDYELESDEAMFWVWGCRQWQAVLSCEISYRCLLPRGLGNLWLACRALGVSQDAHHALRMQRDMQRIGEVAGLAASIAAAQKKQSRNVDMALLKQKLVASGALGLARSASIGELATRQVSSLIDALEYQVDPRMELWQLYAAGPQAAAAPLRRLVETGNVDASWHAAVVLAMWSDPSAQQRLCQAIETRENGLLDLPQDRMSQQYSVMVPRWVTAVSLLRICGDEQCLDTLMRLAADPELVANMRSSIAVSLTRMTARNAWSNESHEKAVAILEQLMVIPPPLSTAPPRRNTLNAKLDVEAAHGYWSPRVSENFEWQMHLSIARARMALGQSPHDAAKLLLVDHRVIVRKAAAQLFENQASMLLV